MKTECQPLVSIVVPCRNEKLYIKRCIESIVSSSYPQDKIEIIVVDGISEDGTRELAEELADKYSFVRVLNNEKKILASGWNMGIENSKGDIIITANAHAEIEKEHIKKCISYMNQYKADCVGPVLITHPQDTGIIGEAIAAVMSHPFGVGNSTFRIGANKPNFVDTLHLGAYKREIFEKIGMYNEDLVRSQDIEMHRRLHYAGFNMLLVPDIKVHYYTRSNPKGFFKYGFLNGYWVTNPWSFGVNIASARHLIPMVFVLSIVTPVIISFFISDFYYASYVIVSLYIFISLLASLHKAINTKKISFFLIMPIIFFIYHITYGVGSIVGFLKSLFSRRFFSLVRKSMLKIIYK
jgi:glycosyltransferase involved in cell wall biosynthesis